jgi:hypothetical protein
MINNREDANRYYQQINDLIDDYIDKWKIKPSNLGRYLKPNSDRFNKLLGRNNLKEVNGIDRILSDVIEDRVNMERDAVLTFENFKFFESDEFKLSNLKQCLYKGIEKADENMEKVLADVFYTNLGSIDVIDSSKHLFKINDWNGEDINVLIYSKEDLEIIKNNMIDYLFEELKSKKVLLGGLVELSLSNITGNVGYIRFSIGNELDLESVISHLLEAEHYESFDGYEIWTEKKDSLVDSQKNPEIQS